MRKNVNGFWGKGFRDNPYNNESTILEIVNLRHERAQLLGFDSHAHFVLEERMAKVLKWSWIFK